MTFIKLHWKRKRKEIKEGKKDLRSKVEEGWEWEKSKRLNEAALEE